MKIIKHIVRKLAFPILAGWIPVVAGLMLVTAAIISIYPAVVDGAILMLARSSRTSTQSLSLGIAGPARAPEIDVSVTRDDGRERVKLPVESFEGARGVPGPLAKEPAQVVAANQISNPN
jgi:hypothetical protein